MRTLVGTISGIDSGGFVFENVFHVNSEDDDVDRYDLMFALLDEIEATIIPEYKASIVNGTKLFDIAVKILLPDTSPTLHRPINENGTRLLDPAIGAVCGMIRFLPALGAFGGRLFAAGVAVGDFVQDLIDPAYEALLSDLGAAFASWDGTDSTYHWQLVTYKPATEDDPASTHDMTHHNVSNRPTSLNKRIRA